MAEERQSTSAAGGARGYKRSWKNLLINKRYQLRFTLFMVIFATLLMVGLGWWVMLVADEATEVATSKVKGDDCGEVPKIGSSTEPAATPDAPTPTPAPADAPPADGAAAPAPADGAAAPAPAPADEPPADAPPADGDATAAADEGEGDGEDEADPGERRRRVVIVESSMTVNPVPERYAEEIARVYECRMRQAGALADIRDGRRDVLLVLILSGLVLVIGLAIYGIKMTHKVAGPLYKITLYMGKMRDGRLDKVYNLRKGDQLVEFYEHFKHAHAGVVAAEKADIERLKAVLEVAEAEQLEGRSPEVDAAIAELRKVLARKEKSLE